MNQQRTPLEREEIKQVHRDVSGKGTGEVLCQLREQEPALAKYIRDELVFVAGKLALSGVPTEAVQGAHEDVLNLVLTSVEALRALSGQAALSTSSAASDGNASATEGSSGNCTARVRRRIGF
jgi:hypothetical protein